MKNLRTTALALAFAVVPAAALAQSSPPPSAGQPGPAGPMMRHRITPQERQQFEQMRRQMAAMHLRTKRQVVAALTPAHRNLLGSIASGLALGTIPDDRTAAQQLDAALSAGEKQRIFTIVDNAHEQERAAMEAARQRFIAQLPAAQQQRMQQMHQQMMQRMGQPGAHAKRPKRARDAGLEVLRIALGGMGGGMPRPFGPMMGGPGRMGSAPGPGPGAPGAMLPPGATGPSSGSPTDAGGPGAAGAPAGQPGTRAPSGQ